MVMVERRMSLPISSPTRPFGIHEMGQKADGESQTPQGEKGGQMTNCKHGVTGYCARCEYEKDLEVNPKAWEWWEYQCRHCGTWHPCNEYMVFTNHKTGPESAPPYRRSPSAPDREEWVAEQDKTSCPECGGLLSGVNGFCLNECGYQRQPDKCATCRHDYEPGPEKPEDTEWKPHWTEVLMEIANWAEYYKSRE